MRLLSVILFMFLILKSSVAMSLSQISASNCCSGDQLVVEQGIDDLSHDNTEDKGCCDLNCDCLCCGHVLITDVDKASEPIKKSVINKAETVYQNNYIMSYQNKVWHPPC